MKAKFIKFGIGILVSIVLIVWLIYSVEWSGVFEALKTAKYIWFIPSTIVVILLNILRAVRWNTFLPDNAESSLRLRFDAVMVGNLANYYLPLRAGEFARPIYLSARSEHKFGVSFVSIVIERFFDLSMVLALFFVLLLFISGVPDWIHRGAYILFIIAAGILTFMVMAAKFNKLLNSIIHAFLAPFSKISALAKFVSMIESFAQSLILGAAVLKLPGRLAQAIFYTAAIWALTLLQIYIYIYTFNVPPTILLSLAITVVLALAVAAPSAPGFVGVYQVACVASFAIFDVSAEVGTAYAIVTHLHQYAIYTVFGLILAFLGGLSTRDLTVAEEAAASS